MLAIKAELLEQQERNTAGSLRCHRAVVVCGRVDDLASFHGVDGDTTTHVAVDEVHILVVLAYGSGILDRLRTGVQQVDSTVLLDLCDSGDLGDIQQVGTHGRVINERRDVHGLCDGIGQKRAQAGCVLRKLGAGHLVVHLLIDPITTALQAEQHAASSNNGGQVLQIVTDGVQLVQDDDLTVVLLRSYIRELHDALLIVYDVLLEENFCIVFCENSDLCGCGSRVDDQDVLDFFCFHAFNSPFHLLTLLFHPRSRRGSPAVFPECRAAP